MILAEVKKTDGGRWETRLYNLTLPQFRSFAIKQFVAIGKVTELPDQMIINQLVYITGWDKYFEGSWVRR